MEKRLTPLLLALLMSGPAMLISGSVRSQTLKDEWKPITMYNQSSPYIRGVMGVWQWVNLGSQSFTIKFRNVTNHKVHVTGTLVALTYCGEVETSFDVKIKPGESVGGEAYLFDMYSMTGSVDADNCKNGQRIPYYEKDALGNTVTRYHLNLIRSLQLRGLQAELADDPPPTTDNTSNNPSPTNSSTSPQNGNGTNNPSGGTAGNGSNPGNNGNGGANGSGTNTQQAATGAAIQQAAMNRQAAIDQANAAEAAAKFQQAQADLMNTGVDAIQQGLATGNNELVYIGYGALMLGGIAPLAVLVGGPGLGAAIAYIATAGAATYIFLHPDHFSVNWFTLKAQLGAGYEQMPLVTNFSARSGTDVVQYPMATFNLKASFFNDRGVCFSLLPFFNHNIPLGSKDLYVNEYQYGSNGELLIGKQNTSHLRLFGEAGWAQRHLNYSNTTLKDAGSFDYQVVRYGGGIMLWTLNKKKTKESYIKPGIFFERPSFATAGQPAAMVGNVQIMLSSCLIIDCSYSKNYFIGGPVHYPTGFSGVNRDLYSIRLIKTSNIF